MTETFDTTLSIESFDNVLAEYQQRHGGWGTELFREDFDRLQSIHTTELAALRMKRDRAIAELVWVLTEVWPLVHGLNTREVVKARFRELPDLIDALATENTDANTN